MKLFGVFAITMLLIAIFTVEAVPSPDPRPGKAKVIIKVAKKTGQVVVSSCLNFLTVLMIS